MPDRERRRKMDMVILHNHYYICDGFGLGGFNIEWRSEVTIAHAVGLTATLTPTVSQDVVRQPCARTARDPGSCLGWRVRTEVFKS